MGIFGLRFVLYPHFCCRFPATNPCGVIAKAGKMDQTWYVHMYLVYVLPTEQHFFMGTKDNWNLAFCSGISRVPKPNYLCVGRCWPSVLWYFNVLHFKTPYWLPARQAFRNGCSRDKKSLSSLLLFIWILLYTELHLETWLRLIKITELNV